MKKMHLADAAQTEALGSDLAAALDGQGAVITLSGELGAGKTTLVRGLLRALGHGGIVRSPTYTLVEPYALARGEVLHLDLYRLAEARDLEALGLREALDGSALVLVEWPERAAAALPTADLVITLTHRPDGREARLEGGSALGKTCLARL